MNKSVIACIDIALTEARASSHTLPMRTPREASSRFTALIDARRADASSANFPAAAFGESAMGNSNSPDRTGGMNPHEPVRFHVAPPASGVSIAVSQTERSSPPLAPSVPRAIERPNDCADAEPRVAEPAMPTTAPVTAGSQCLREGPAALTRVMRATSAADDVERLIDELAEFALRQPGTRAEGWSVTLWLRAEFLRDTRLTMSGEPGRIAVTFATDNAASLRCLRAGHQDLQARLRERICVPTLDVTIDATRPEVSPL
jgi:hypothetical protein